MAAQDQGDASRVLILGGGLTGIGTALHLGRRPWMMLEREDRLGGHARTDETRGFFFDKTGHWLHLRDAGIKALVESVLPGQLVSVERKARVFSHGVLTRYPFQGNLHGLPPAVNSECLLGFLDAQMNPSSEAPRNFEEYCLQKFGVGISKHFMVPYNEKLWGVHPREITSAWCSRFVPVPKLPDVVRGAVGDVPPEIGYNVSFLYPKQGGIETLVRGLVSRLDASRIHTRSQPERICVRDHAVELGGERLRYGALVASAPLPELVKLLDDAPREVVDAADKLRCTAVRYLNVATRRPAKAAYHWLYVPERQYPFYRVGVYTNAVPSMAPPGCGSLYVELSERGPMPSLDAILPGIAEALVAAQVLDAPDDILFAELKEIRWAYVVFDEHYYDAVGTITRYLESVDIYPRGRYGSWTYNSMEDCLIAGRQVAELLLQPATK